MCGERFGSYEAIARILLALKGKASRFMVLQGRCQEMPLDVAICMGINGICWKVLEGVKMEGGESNAI